MYLLGTCLLSKIHQFDGNHVRHKFRFGGTNIFKKRIEDQVSKTTIDFKKYGHLCTCALGMLYDTSRNPII